jgi:hypothetical protein
MNGDQLGMWQALARISLCDQIVWLRGDCTEVFERMFLTVCMGIYIVHSLRCAMDSIEKFMVHGTSFVFFIHVSARAFVVLLFSPRSAVVSRKSKPLLLPKFSKTPHLRTIGNNTIPDVWCLA